MAGSVYPELAASVNDEPEPALVEERPLATFALFSFNQEKYIREAVEAALSQIYEPLEIILSDDCSTDRTFQIMRDVASAYSGPHRVVVRKNERNLGLIEHVNTVIAGASGEVILLAAGDDISVPERAQRTVQCFSSHPDAMLVHSMVTVIDESGHECGVREPPFVGVCSDAGRLAVSTGIYIGAAGAIRRRVFSDFGPIAETGTYEDLTLGFRAALIGTLVYLAEPLVQYRRDVGLSSRFRRWKGSRKDRRIASIRHRVATLSQRSRDLNSLGNPGHRAIDDIISHHQAITQARLDLHAAPAHFIRGFFARGAFCSVKAIVSELRFLLRMVD